MYEQQGEDLSLDLKREENPTSSKTKFFNQLTISEDAFEQVAQYAREKGIKFFDLGKISKERIDSFYSENLPKLKIQKTLINACKNNTTETRAANRYDIEYGTTAYEPFVKAFEGSEVQGRQKRAIASLFREETNYSFYSALLDPVQYLRIITPEIFSVPGDIVDVGCGNGQLVDCLIKTMEIPPERLIGIDVSPASTFLVSDRKVRTATGSLPNVLSTSPEVFNETGASVLFLSYFIDRDIDQKGTFNSAASVLANNGSIILEGLFPVNPTDSTGARYATEESLITKGVSIADDIEQIRLNLEKNSIYLEKIVLGERLVFSMDLFEILPSIFLVFKKRS